MTSHLSDVRRNHCLKHILIVEDEHDISIMLRRCLEDQGYYVTYTDSRASGLAIVERVKLNLLIANVVLPDGTAFDITDLARRKEIPFMLMTGSVEHMSQLDANGQFFLAKPFHLVDFLAEVEKLIGVAGLDD